MPPSPTKQQSNNQLYKPSQAASLFYQQHPLDMEICEAPRRYTMQGSVAARQLLDTSSVGFAKGFVRLTHVKDGVSLGCEFGLGRVDDSQQWSMELTPASFAAGTTLQNLYFGAAESSIDRTPLSVRRPPKGSSSLQCYPRLHLPMIFDGGTGRYSNLPGTCLKSVRNCQVPSIIFATLIARIPVFNWHKPSRAALESTFKQG